ncbi:MAG: DNA/RNA non-specific endonuclease [Bacteroidota bacterium]
MKPILLFLSLLCAAFCYSQDTNDDYSAIIEDSKPLQHLLSLFTIHGVPKNQNQDDSLTILINHGYCIGFSKKNNQPLWVAYQVSKAKKDVDYERFPFFVDDRRLPEANQIGSQTFGGGFDLGHMAPNAAINRQFGKMSQMETFLMSNICPQKAGLNQGVWQKLEAAILNTYCNTVKDTTHVWVLVGPILSDNPEFITRENGTKVAIPDSFYCILARPFRYPYDRPGNAQYLPFIFSQNLLKTQPLNKSFLVNINRIEERTGINFFPNFTVNNQATIETKTPTALW